MPLFRSISPRTCSQVGKRCLIRNLRQGKGTSHSEWMGDNLQAVGQTPRRQAVRTWQLPADCHWHYGWNKGLVSLPMFKCCHAEEPPNLGSSDTQICGVIWAFPHQGNHVCWRHWTFSAFQVCWSGRSPAEVPGPTIPSITSFLPNSGVVALKLKWIAECGWWRVQLQTNGAFCTHWTVCHLKKGGTWGVLVILKRSSTASYPTPNSAPPYVVLHPTHPK